MVNSILERKTLMQGTFGMDFKIKNDIESPYLFRKQKGYGIGILKSNPNIAPYTSDTCHSLR